MSLFKLLSFKFEEKVRLSGNGYKTKVSVLIYHELDIRCFFKVKKYRKLITTLFKNLNRNMKGHLKELPYQNDRQKILYPFFQVLYVNIDD